ncbi:MAG: glycine zipper 2TM domain-containing protein [Gammaproteobacteria bacterium]|jgi:uncharacterized protein YcfJ
MNAKISATLALGLCFAAGAASAHGVRYTTARVIGVEPVYETVVVQQPYRRCHTEIVERPVRTRAVAGQTLAGAIVGAAIGRQFGDGSGRDALTVIGAVAGSAVANDRAMRRQGVRLVQQPVERCTTEYRRHAERQLTGYWVDYRHRGRRYRILSRERPGRHIRIAVRS